ncbi:transketolase [Candidatus Woesearchaeota archaeon]|nr:transketolase [Candidatus Woesearchaeota archaeon]
MYKRLSPDHNMIPPDRMMRNDNEYEILISQLQENARHLRGDALIMTSLAKSGHVGGSMSSADIFNALYSLFARVSPDDPWNPERDRVVIGPGHYSAIAYATLARCGFFPLDDVYTGFRNSTLFDGHVNMHIPGVEWSTGNLGQGLSAAAAMAYASKRKGIGNMVWYISSDGESQKGQLDEARRAASKLGLDNLVAIVDYNERQIMGDFHRIMDVDIFGQYTTDGWEAIGSRQEIIDGHDYRQLIEALGRGKGTRGGRPKVIIARTVMGKGYSRIEGDSRWHGSPLPESGDGPNLKEALSELGLSDEEYCRIRDRRTTNDGRNVIKYSIPKRPLPRLIINSGKPRVYPAGEKKSPREGYGNALMDLEALNPGKITGIDHDLGGSTQITRLSDDSLLQLGITEHNGAAFAGALSLEGFLVFHSTFARFGIEEVFNQQYLNALNRTNLKAVYTHIGSTVGEDGATHHSVNYIGMMRQIPSFEPGEKGFKVMIAADANQADRMIRHMSTKTGNDILLLSRESLPIITDKGGKTYYGRDYVFEYGKDDWLRGDEDSALTIFTYGHMVQRVLDAVSEFADEDIAVVNKSCPLEKDEESLGKSLKTGKILVVEDHLEDTGLASILSREFWTRGLASENFHNMGVKRFGISAPAESALTYHGISTKDIRLKIQSLL